MIFLLLDCLFSVNNNFMKRVYSKIIICSQSLVNCVNQLDSLNQPHSHIVFRIAQSYPFCHRKMRDKTIVSVESCTKAGGI